MREYLKRYNNYIYNNVNVTYVKKNFLSILFSFLFSPTLLLLFIQGAYYENNNNFKMLEYIRNFEILNLFLEYLYINPYVFRSSMILHHIMTIILCHTLLLYQYENLPMLLTYIDMCNLLITTNIMLGMVQIFHKNNILKVVFIIYYFIVRIIIPFEFVKNVSTGHYLKITPTENIPVSLFLSALMYLFYGLNIYWFYKIIYIARKKYMKV